MTGHLLDVNVLIALIDPLHVHHERAHTWFADSGRLNWLSCPTTQNGCVRIVTNPRYPNSANLRDATASLTSLLSAGTHRFVADSLSLLDEAHVDLGRVLGSGQVTDTYLVALAVAEGARLATFDRNINPYGARGRTDATVVQVP